jgi:acetyltransferase
LGEAKLPTFETPSASIEGFMQLVRYKRAQEELMQTPPQLPEGQPPDAAEAKAVIAGALARGRSILSEVEAKRILAAYGISTVETRVATSAAAVHAVAAEVLRTAKTCVIKVISDDISHKSDIGGVRLDLSTPETAQRAAFEILERIERERPGSRVSGFSVQPMIKRPRAHELIIGMSHDATFGPLLLFGAGGTAVEVLRDTAMALPPLDLKLARELMRQTRIHRLLEGYRDRPAADLDAIAMSLVRLGAMVIAHPEIREIDVNPLLADETGIIALDARIRVDTQSPRRPLAIRPYPVTWTRQINLPEIGQLKLRPIRPEDEWLRKGLVSCSATFSLRMRPC